MSNSIEDKAIKMKEITNASDATEKGRSFLLEKYPLRGKIARPISTTRENNIWIIEFNVGVVKALIATLKIDGSSGEVVEYTIPPVAET
jgi:hypothetical protein